MQALHERCAGLDVDMQVVVTILLTAATGQASDMTRTFGDRDRVDTAITGHCGRPS
jgi:hypothetical protein